MTQRTLKEVIQQYNVENGYEDSPSEDYEYFVECLSETVVQEDTESKHRWYDVRSVVHQVTIDGVKRFFETFDYHITGDNSASDMDLDLPTINDVGEVFPYEVVQTIYK